jgi:hypothetical protein
MVFVNILRFLALKTAIPVEMADVILNVAKTPLIVLKIAVLLASLTITRLAITTMFIGITPVIKKKKNFKSVEAQALGVTGLILVLAIKFIKQDLEL